MGEYQHTMPVTDLVKYDEDAILKEQDRERGEFKLPTHRPIRVQLVVPMMDDGVSHNLATLLAKLAAGEMETYGAQVQIDLVGKLSPRDFMRNFIARNKFMPSGADYLYWIDSDVSPPANFMSLVEHRKEVAGGIYLMYQSKFEEVKVQGRTRYEMRPTIHPCIFKKVVKGFREKRDMDQYIRYAPVAQFENEELMEVDAMGTGCMMIHRSVFERIPYPYFLNQYKEDGAEGMTEDIDFAYKLNFLGISQWSDPKVYCRHYKKLNLQEVHLAAVQMAKNEVKAATSVLIPEIVRLRNVEKFLRAKLASRGKKHRDIILPDNLREKDDAPNLIIPGS